jgi:hypothetical protein
MESYPREDLASMRHSISSQLAVPQLMSRPYRFSGVSSHQRWAAALGGFRDERLSVFQLPDEATRMLAYPSCEHDATGGSGCG